MSMMLLVIKDGLGIRRAELTTGITPGKRLKDQQSSGTSLGNV